tara:strand:- start:57 stop:1001 length:945 start_codon:yes stop_codon:yes gene_type:complete
MQSQFSAQSQGTWPRPSAGTFNIDLLVVAGGGGGAEGGGGGGGYRILSCQPSGPGTYTVTIGAGGNAGTHTVKGTNGADSIWNVGPANITSTGGGAGGTGQPATLNANPGGSGGGGGMGTGSAGSGNTPAVPAPLGGPQGNSGAPGTKNSPTTYNNSGGGGGANAAACCAVGGAGKSAIPVFGAAPQPYYPAPTYPSGGEGYFAGGGGGRRENPNPAPPALFAGGIGGGGMGSNGGNTPPGGAPAPSKTGVVNSGGGGGMYYPGCLGSGGSGVVLVKIPSAAYPFVSICGSNSLVPTPSGGVARFVASGALTVD